MTSYTVKDPLTIYTDGSCQNYANLETRKKKGHGGWAFIVVGEPNIYNSGFCHAPQTSQAMEIKAVLEALRWIKQHGLRNEHVLIRSDSMHVINGWMSGWMETAAEFGWEGYANADLWRRMHMHHSKVPKLRFLHVKGHVGHKFNEIADRIASNARRNGLLNLQRAEE